MKLVALKIRSIYNNNSPLPMPMGQWAEDAATALLAVQAEIESLGGYFCISDGFRTHAQQVAAHNDWKFGRKKAYSPPAGGSMHEAARAIDLHLAALIHPPSVPKGCHVFSWDEIKAIFRRHGWTPIAPGGDQHSVDIKEKWHFDFRGKFDATYRNAPSNKYHTMAAAAIADLDIYQTPGSKPGLGTAVTGNESAQSRLVRLGYLTEAQAKGGDGPFTRKAIRTFQKEHGLRFDGIVGPLTGAALGAAVAKLPAA